MRCCSTSFRASLDSVIPFWQPFWLSVSTGARPFQVIQFGAISRPQPNTASATRVLARQYSSFIQSELAARQHASHSPATGLTHHGNSRWLARPLSVPQQAGDVQSMVIFCAVRHRDGGRRRRSPRLKMFTGWYFRSPGWLFRGSWAATWSRPSGPSRMRLTTGPVTGWLMHKARVGIEAAQGQFGPQPAGTDKIKES